MNEAPEIRMDESRAFSSIHGECNPGDPHYGVSYFQDSLPFGASKVLVPDDGKTDSWTEAVEREDGSTRIVRHYPLYTPLMRAKLEKRLKKLSATKRAIARPAPQVVLDGDGQEIPAENLTFGPDEVNLISWLKGEIDYQPNEIFAACKKRFGMSFNTKRAVVEELVYDHKPPLLPEAEVSPALIAMLDQPASVAA